MTAEDALSLIKRMQLTYDPPRALRGRPEAIKERLRVYFHALAPFDAETLDKAWLEAAGRHRYPSWPDCPDFLAAAEQFHALKYPKAKVADDWVEKATALTDAYTCRFMETTQAAMCAREAGYERELKSYVREASWVQAQLIVGRKSVGYSSGVLFPGRERDKLAEGEFFGRAREQAESGHIKVTVPRGMIERWRAEASQGRSR